MEPLSGMKKHRKSAVVVLAPLALFAAFGTLLFAGLQRDDEGGLPSGIIGRTAPLAPAALGRSDPPNDADLLAGGAKLVNFWASWCAPCRVEHPNLMAMAAEGVVILGINYKDDESNALDFLAELGDPFSKIGADRDGRVGIEWGVYGIPETFVVDGDGKVALRFAGPITSRVMRERILPALASASD